jgi:DNA (cytosine-5)-methyltransferase 1
MRHLDLFTGIGGFALAAQTVWGKDYEPVAFCEIDKFCQKVLKKHWPNVEIIDDIRKITNNCWGRIDLITAGFPCQDVSIAGKRKGLKGEQTGLFWELARVIELVKPKWIVLENVCGLLSSNNGKDMAEILNKLSEIGYCVGWRVLNAQYFGVAQRRKRVFFVGSFGNTNSVRVLFEPKGNGGNNKKVKTRREKCLCITTRDGQRQDPTNETIVGTSVRTCESGKRTQGYIAESLTAKSYGERGWPLQNETSQIIANVITAESDRHTARYPRQGNYIATIVADREGTVNGISRKLDTHRGRALGNAIVPQVAMVIMEAIKEIDDGNRAKERSKSVV